MKVCAACGIEKSASDFHKMARTKSGLQPRCKACRKQQAAERYDPQRHRAAYLERRDVQLEAERQRRASDPEFRARSTQRFREWMERNRQERRDYMNAYLRARRAKQRAPTRETVEFRGALRSDQCSYCGSRHDIVIDHIVPIARDGENDWTNLTAACSSCNRRKSAKPLLLWLLEIENGHRWH